MKYLNITACNFDYIAKSENLLGTSNLVFTDWVVCTFFKIENDVPVAHFTVCDKMFSSNVLFETNNYKELKNWIKEHSKEIKEQIDSKAKEWIEKHKDIYQ